MDNLNTQKSTVKLAKMGLLVAISIVLVYFIHFPIFPAVSFLEYDPADISIMIGTFAFGPLAGFIGSVQEINKDKGKVKVLVSMFGRETPVELDFAQVEKI